MALDPRIYNQIESRRVPFAVPPVKNGPLYISLTPRPIGRPKNPIPAIRNDDESSKDVEANDVGLTDPHKDNEGAPNKLLSESTALLSNEYRANQTQPSIPQPKYMQMGANGAISASKLIPLNPEGKEQSDNQRYEDGQPYIRGDESSSTNNHHTTARALENVGNENQQVNPFWLSSHPNNSGPSSRPTKISQATYPIHAGPYSHPTSGAPASQSTNITPAPHPTNVAPASHPGNVPPTSHPINVAPESYQIHAGPYSHVTNVKPYFHPTNSVPSSCPTNVAPELYPIHAGPSSYPTNVAPALYQNQPLYQHHVWQQSPQMWPPLHPTYTWLPSNQNPYYSVPMGANWGCSSQQYLQAPNANTAIGFRNAESLTFNQQPQTYQVTAQPKPSQYENNSSNQIQKAVSELARAFQMFEAKMLSISNVDVPVNFIPRSSSLSMQGVEESGGVLESGDVSAQPILQPVHTRFWHEEISKLAIHWEKSKGVRVGNLFEIKYEGLYSSKAHPMSNPFTVAFRSDVTKVEMDKAIAANVNAIDIRLNCNGSTDHCTANMKGITGIISARSKCPECQQNSSAPACVNCKRDTRRRCTFALVAVVKAKDLTQVVTIFQHPHRMSSGSDYKRQGIAPIITEFVRALQEPTMGRVRSFGAVANRFRSFPEHVLASPKDVKRVETQTMKRMKAIGESDPFEALVALQREYPGEFRILQNLPENGKPSKKGPFHGIFMSDENILSWLMTPEVIGIDSMFNVNENGAPVTILTSTHSTTNHSYPAAVLLSSCVTEEMYTLFLKAAVANVEEYAKKAVSNGCMPDGHETKVQGGMEYMKEVCREGFSRRVLVVKQDFSIALRNAVRAVFPDAIISGCLVHLCRIIESEMTSEKVHGTNDDLCKVLGKLGKWLSPEVYDFISKQLSEVAEEKADISASVRVGVNIPAKRKRNGEIHLSYSKDFRADLYYHIQFVLRSTSREHSRSLWNEFFLKMYPLIQKHYEQLPTIDQKRQAAALILYFASGLADPEGWGATLGDDIFDIANSRLKAMKYPQTEEITSDGNRENNASECHVRILKYTFGLRNNKEIVLCAAAIIAYLLYMVGERTVRARNRNVEVVRLYAEYIRSGIQFVYTKREWISLNEDYTIPENEVSTFAERTHFIVSLHNLKKGVWVTVVRDGLKQVYDCCPMNGGTKVSPGLGNLCVHQMIIDNIIRPMYIGETKTGTNNNDGDNKDSDNNDDDNKDSDKDDGDNNHNSNDTFDCDDSDNNKLDFQVVKKAGQRGRPPVIEPWRPYSHPKTPVQQIEINGLPYSGINALTSLPRKRRTIS